MGQKAREGSGFGDVSVGTVLGTVALAGILSLAVAVFVHVPTLVQKSMPFGAFCAAVALSVALCFALISVLQYQIACNGRIVFNSVAFAGTICWGALLFMPDLAPLAVQCLLFIGCVGVFGLVSFWFCWICSQERLLAQSIMSVSGIAVCAVNLFALTFNDLVARATFLIIMIAVMVIMNVFYERFPIAENLVYIRNRESDAASKILPSSTLMLSVISFEFGLLLPIAYERGAYVPCIAVVLLSFVFLLLDNVTARRISERSLHKLIPPLTTTAILSLFMFGGQLQLVALCVLSVLYGVYTCFGWLAMAQHVGFSHLSPLRVFARARAVDYVSLALGLVVGAFLVEQAKLDVLFVARASAAIAVVYSFLAAYFHKSRFPEAGLEGEPAGAGQRKGMWKQRCRAVGDAYALSERQFEVLVLMSQGRNAKYIEKALTISLSTAQTHIRNVYRKLGVHSRQELLDLIENMKLYGED